MEQIKPVAELSQEANAEQQEAVRTDVRTLNELELVLCGGGDGHINW